MTGKELFEIFSKYYTNTWQDSSGDYGVFITTTRGIDKDDFELLSDKINDCFKEEKVTIPQFVAEWIEEIQNSGLEISDLLNLRNIKLRSHTLYKWCFGPGNFDNVNKLARAWLDGYEVGEPKKYTVTLDNGNKLYMNLVSVIDDIPSFNNGQVYDDVRYELTQEEIESVDPILMKIAKEVE